MYLAVINQWRLSFGVEFMHEIVWPFECALDIILFCFDEDGIRRHVWILVHGFILFQLEANFFQSFQQIIIFLVQMNVLLVIYLFLSRIFPFENLEAEGFV